MPMRRASLSLRGKLLLGTVPTSLEIAASILVYRALAVSVATSERVNLTSQRIAFANVAIRAVVEAEASQRGHVITGAARHLERYNEALRTFDKVARRLREQLPAASEQGYRQGGGLREGGGGGRPRAGRVAGTAGARHHRRRDRGD